MTTTDDHVKPQKQPKGQDKLLPFIDYIKDNRFDELERHLKDSIDDQTLDIQWLVNLAKLSKESAKLVQELVILKQIDQTELADKIAKQIIIDIENYVDNHLEKFQKYTLNALQQDHNDESTAQFFNIIGLLKDVSILGRKLLEAAPRFESPRQPRTASPSSASSIDKSAFFSINKCKQHAKSTSLHEEDATSEDLLAALIESSSSDDFLVLTSSLESISVKDMVLAALIYIKAHECFTLSHDIQGVVLVLRRVKFLILNILTPKNQMELITKLLTSIGRYSEMNYVFDLFRDRNQFEILLSKGVEKTPELRIALFNYVKKNPEFYALVTLNFSMFCEIAESLKASALKRLNKMIHSKRSKMNKANNNSSSSRHNFVRSSSSHDLECSASSSSSGAMMAGLAPSSGPTTITSVSSRLSSNPTTPTLGSTSSSTPSSGNKGTDGSGGGGGSGPSSGAIINNKTLYSKESLNLCLVELVDASDCFAKAGCYKRSESCERKAKLLALQLANLTGETNLLGLQQSELSDLIVSLDNFSDAYIVAEAYDYHLAWRQALFRNVILNGHSNYLSGFVKKCDLSSALILEIVFLYKQYITNNQAKLSHDESLSSANSMKMVLKYLNDVELRCKIYTQLNFNDAKEELLQNPSVKAYLKDLKLA